jgi:hypothetical protein
MRMYFFQRDDHKLGPRAKLLRVRLCDWSTQVVSVDFIFRLQRLKKEQHLLRLLQSLPPKMSLIGVPHSVSLDLKSNQIFRNPTIHGPLSYSSVNRRTWISQEWMICLHPVYHGDDDLVAVEVPKPRHKWNYRPNRVSISSHITTYPATLPTFQSLTLDKGRKSEGRTGACHFPQHSTPTNQPVRCLLDFIYQRVNLWSNPPSLQGL